ncbi:AAA family ATPase [Bowmanella denitrificans]|uniref:AAA family ATPase n=1 Tax=Bowmanella denitrificans TaxID=366582 RepID=UPI000C9C1BE1|nr:ATP-binding protein [Bowmanella denitrificans]
MKSTVARTSNVMAAFEAFQNLMDAAQSGSPAIGMFTGKAGYGKTTAGVWLFAQANGLLVRCLKADSPRSFLERIGQELGLDKRWSKVDTFNFIIKELCVTRLPLFIDECDYIADKPEILETIRDIYDMANVPIIMIGYAELPRKIKRLEQLDSRVAQHVEFKPANSGDIAIMAKALLENCSIADCLAAQLLDVSKGSYRRIHTALDKIEKFAKANKLTSVTAEQWGNQAFFPSAQ